MRWLKAVIAWLLILATAVLNGVYREAVLLPQLGVPGALLVSGLLLSLAILAWALALARWLRLAPGGANLRIGALWLALTVAFEFGFGRLLQQRPWSELLEPYTFQDGNVWPIVLLVTLFAPAVAARVRAPRT
jgi:hypothetical protein